MADKKGVSRDRSRLNLIYLLLGLGFLCLVIIVLGVSFSKILFTAAGQTGKVEGLHEVARQSESADPLVTMTDNMPAIDKSDPVLGKEGAKVNILTYANFDCGYCGVTDEVLKNLVALYPQDVRVVWKDAPEDSQGDSYQAAIAARCAQDQGKFWEMHDLLFQNQYVFTRGNFSKLASQLGLDLGRFDSCFDNKETASYVDAGLKEADALGIFQIPYYFVNEMEFTGFGTLEDFKAIVDYELGKDAAECL